ncbi:MAG: hypothetical protein AB7G37_21710 [Solirubrobacteraceae bacterium]
MKRQRVAVIDLPTRLDVWAYTDDGTAHHLSRGDYVLDEDLTTALARSRRPGSLEALMEARERLTGERA